MDFNISLEKNKGFSVTRDDLLILQPEREHISVKSGLEEQTILPTGEKVIGSVVVQAWKLQDRYVNVLPEEQEIVAEAGFDALSKVIVEGVDQEFNFAKLEAVRDAVTSGGTIPSDEEIREIIEQAKLVANVVISGGVV